MYGSETTLKRNQLCFNNPELGDYWHERFSPVFLVAKVMDNLVVGFKGISPLVRETLPISQLVAEHLVILTREEFNKLLQYETIEGFSSDCIRYDEDQFSNSEAINNQTIDSFLEKGAKIKEYLSSALPLIVEKLEAYKSNSQ
jgi:hypothetical protein